jgi:SAM-dependent methyltransferase
MLLNAIPFLQPLTAMSDNSTDAFFAAWRTYRKIVETNYMYHREIGEQVEATLRAAFGEREFSVLDLGCGDAATFAPRLASLRPSRYVGVDLSETALGLAADSLFALACPVELRRQDLLTAIAGSGESFDLLHTSFALHHLPTERKAEFFGHAFLRLAPGGVLLLTDVMREEDETLAVYHGRYTAWLRSEWTQLTPEERDSTCAHLVENDRPEPYSVLQALGREAGFSVSPVARFGWHRTVKFTKPRAA